MLEKDTHKRLHTHNEINLPGRLRGCITVIIIPPWHKVTLLPLTLTCFRPDIFLIAASVNELFSVNAFTYTKVCTSVRRRVWAALQTRGAAFAAEDGGFHLLCDTDGANHQTIPSFYSSWSWNGILLFLQQIFNWKSSSVHCKKRSPKMEPNTNLW